MNSDSRHPRFTIGRRHRHAGLAGFTLIEVMISLALMLLLMLGVNYIFSSVGKATGATTALSHVGRDSQAALAVFSRDFAAADFVNSPFITLRSIAKPAFRNQADALSDDDYDPSAPNPDQILTVDLNGDGAYNDLGERISPATYNFRNHRQDIFSFFARDHFGRQTGGGKDMAGNEIEPYVADMTAGEAWIWYGLLALPVDGTSLTFRAPGALTAIENPHNFYASQHSLGRVVMLLQEPQFINGGWHIYTPAGQPTVDHWYYAEGTGDLEPLAEGTLVGNGGPNHAFANARYDLVGTSMAKFRQKLQDHLAANATNPDDWWWDRLMLGQVDPNDSNRAAETRFHARPYILNTTAGTSRLTPEKVATQAPIFLQGCTQFIVEYAGDFLEQDNNPQVATYGDVTDVYYSFTGHLTGTTDGQVDFVVKTDPTGVKYRTVRWYGLPRDTNGDGIINGTGTSANVLQDVVPLRDVVQTRFPASTPPALFERFADGVTSDSLPQKADYADPISGGMQTGEYYTCAWGPGDRRPSMIRITVVLDDPAGKLPQGQSYEYVFKVK